MLVSLLVFILVLGLIYWLINYVLPLPPPFKMAANVVVAIIAIIWLLNLLGVVGSRPILG